jgi:hypothetical protein
MPRIILNKNEELSINFPLFEKREISGAFINRETFESDEQGHSIIYQDILYNIKNKNCYIVKITIRNTDYLRFVLASNIDDFSIWINSLRKDRKYQKVEVKQVIKFQTEDVRILTDEELKKKGLI